MGRPLRLIRIGSRKSDLARLQAMMVGQALLSQHPDLEIQYIFKETAGDQDATTPLWKFANQGVFTGEFYQGLVTDQYDLVVHSWKDLPILPQEKTEITATLRRDDPRDLLLVRRDALRAGEVFHILTSSPRRREALQIHLPELLPVKNVTLKFEVIRGNIQTRITKLQAGEGDALVMAKAALDRLLLQDFPEFQSSKAALRNLLRGLDFMILPLRYFPPAPAQGALAVETLRGRGDVRDLFKSIRDEETFANVEEERTILKKFGGGCSLAVGTYVGQHVAGKIVFEAGQVENTPRFERAFFKNNQPLPKINRAGVFQSTDFFQIEYGEIVPTPNANAFAVAHPRIAPLLQNYLATEQVQGAPKTIWSAGLATWKALANIGIWTHGSDDGLGELEGQFPSLDHLTGRTLEWQKLTHADAAQKANESSYRLQEGVISQETLAKLQTSDIFFWKSRKIFEKAVSLVPTITTKLHACGPGKTFRWLKNKIPKDRLYVFIDEKDFLEQFNLR